MTNTRHASVAQEIKGLFSDIKLPPDFEDRVTQVLLSRFPPRKKVIDGNQDCGERALVRSTDPSTSRRAADHVNTLALRDLILMTIAANPEPVSPYDIADQTGTPIASLTPRMPAIRKLGLAKVVGEKQKENGQYVNVYSLTQVGWDYLWGKNIPTANLVTH